MTTPDTRRSATMRWTGGVEAPRSMTPEVSPMLDDSTIAARLWSGAVADGAGCWVWQRSTDTKGYGRLWVDGRNQHAHRRAYELVKGPIPDGLTIDHLCRVHACINPDHLEAVTNRENILRGTGPTAANARKTHCLRGHPFDEANTRVHHGHRRICRTCHRLRRAARRRVKMRRSSMSAPV